MVPAAAYGDDSWATPEVAPRVTKALSSPSGGRIEVPMQMQICYPGSVINEIYSLANTEL